MLPEFSQEEKVYDPKLVATVSVENMEYACATCLKKFRASDGTCPHCAAQHSVHLTALRRVLAVSLLFNVVLLEVVLFTIGGN